MKILKYFWCIQLFNDEEAMVCTDDDLKGYDNLMPMDYPVIEHWPSGITFWAEGGRPYDYLRTAVDWPLFSDRLKKAVESAKLTGIEFYPVQVICKLGTRLPRYWYAHILHIPNVLALDRMTNFDVDYVDGKPLISYIKAVFLGDKLQSRDFLRIAESSADVYVSERVVKLFEGGGFTGLEFRPVKVVWEKDSPACNT